MTQHLDPAGATVAWDDVVVRIGITGKRQESRLEATAVRP